VMSAMANYWASKGWHVSLLLIGKRSFPSFDLDDAVSVVELDHERKSAGFGQSVLKTARSILAIRSAIASERPDVVISFLDWTNVRVLLGTLGLRTPVIVSERADPRFHPMGAIPRLLRKLVYPRASGLVVQSKAVAAWAMRMVSAGKIHIIQNPIEIPVDTRRKLEFPWRKPFVLAVGRLTRQKGHDLLLRAFAEVVQKHPEWSLVVLGEGEERSQLETLVQHLKIEGHVWLPGLKKNPSEVMRHAELFVLPSRYEGFPNALCEAMACALPVISFDCPSGPREIIRDGVNGILVPPDDSSALARAIDTLISDVHLRQRLAAHAVEAVSSLGMERIMKMWEELIDEVRAKRSTRTWHKENR